MKTNRKKVIQSIKPNSNETYSNIYLRFATRKIHWKCFGVIEKFRLHNILFWPWIVSSLPYSVSSSLCNTGKLNLLQPQKEGTELNDLSEICTNFMRKWWNICLNWLFCWKLCCNRKTAFIFAMNYKTYVNGRIAPANWGNHWIFHLTSGLCHVFNNFADKRSL